MASKDFFSSASSSRSPISYSPSLPLSTLSVLFQHISISIFFIHKWNCASFVFPFEGCRRHFPMLGGRICCVHRISIDKFNVTQAHRNLYTTYIVYILSINAPDIAVNATISSSTECTSYTLYSQQHWEWLANDRNCQLYECWQVPNTHSYTRTHTHAHTFRLISNAHTNQQIYESLRITTTYHLLKNIGRYCT